MDTKEFKEAYSIKTNPNAEFFNKPGTEFDNSRGVNPDNDDELQRVEPKHPVEDPEEEINSLTTPQYRSSRSLLIEETQAYELRVTTNPQRASDLVYFALDPTCLLYTSPSPRDRG